MATKMTIVDHAISMAVTVHHGQQRQYTGLPYVGHCFDVAHHTRMMCHGNNPNTDIFVAAALLHDTLEDTDLKRSEIKRRCGDDVLHIVECLTHDESTHSDVEYLRYINTVDLPIWVIKVADRYCNVRDLEREKPTKLSKYAFEGSELGLRKVTDAELADSGYNPKEVYTRLNYIRARSEYNL